MAKHITIFGIIAAFVAKWIVDEAKAWTPWCARRLFDVSICLLPATERQRYSEEWCGHLESLPGTVVASTQFIWAAMAIRLLVLKRALMKGWLQFRSRAIVFGVIAYCWLSVRLTRLFGSGKSTLQKGSTADSNLIVWLVIIIIAMVAFENLSKPKVASAA